MSAIANLTLTRSITTTGKISGIANGGTLNTDFKQETWSPIGVDSKGVASWRSPVVTKVSDCAVMSFSNTINTSITGKAKPRLVVTLPCQVTENGISVVRYARANIQLELNNSMSELQVGDFVNIVASSLQKMADNVSQFTPVY